MSCPPPPPHQHPEYDPTHAFPDDDDALSSSSSSESDYGSDFSPHETDLLNQLLAQADAPGPAVPAVADSSHQQQQQLLSQDEPTRKHARIPDIEDLGNGTGTDAPDRVPRVLGRGTTPPVWEVQVAGGALPDAGAHKAKWVPVSWGAAIGMFLFLSLLIFSSWVLLEN